MKEDIQILQFLVYPISLTGARKIRLTRGWSVRRLSCITPECPFDVNMDIIFHQTFQSQCH